jgi:8-oxo-dGTP diphosphatase
MRPERRRVFGHPINARGLITDVEERWLLVQSRHGGDDWRFPGGRGRAGESPAYTCGRELFEELGLILTPGDLIITTFTEPLSPAHRGQGRVNFLFDCGVHSAGELSITMQEEEITAAEWIPRAEALALLHPSDHHMISLARGGLHYGEYQSTPATAAAPAAGQPLH